MKGINRSGRGFGKTREPSKCWAAVRDKAGLGEWLRASLIKNLVKNLPAMQETPSSIPGLGRSPGEGIGYPLQYSWASLVAHLRKKPPAMWETPGLGRSLGEGKGYPHQYSGLENSMDCIVHGGHKESYMISGFHSFTHWGSGSEHRQDPESRQRAAW